MQKIYSSAGNGNVGNGNGIQPRIEPPAQPGFQQVQPQQEQKKQPLRRRNNGGYGRR